MSTPAHYVDSEGLITQAEELRAPECPSLYLMTPMVAVRQCAAMALSDSAFRKRYRSSYETPSPSPTLPTWKRYRGTYKPILDTDSEGDELGDEDTDEDGEDESLDVDDDEDHSLDDEGCGLEGERLSSEKEEEAVPEGQQQAVPAANTAMGEPLRLGYGALRHHRVSAFRQPTLTTWVDPEDGRVYTDIPVYVPPVSPVQTPPSPEWSSDSCSYFTISPSASKERIDVTFRLCGGPYWHWRHGQGVGHRLAIISWDRYDDHRLSGHVSAAGAMQSELQEMRGRVML
ncbi:hypothetical protein Tco_0478294 [Tanacetum coccineum]